MERKLTTCPETMCPAKIEYERTPLGVLIIECSRFQPRCAIECTCACAREMDRDDITVDYVLDSSDEDWSAPWTDLRTELS